MAQVRVLDGGKRAPRLTLGIPEAGTPEFWLWALILMEMGFLLWLRMAFKGAHGG